MKTSSRLSLQLSRVATILLAPMLMLSAQTSRAGSATWLPSPPSNIWNNAANWTAGGPPNSLSDTATFNSSSQTGISLSATTGLNGIIFNPGASAYTITIIPGLALDITGTGIANSGGVTQNYLAATNTSNSGGAISFRNNATAGSSTVFTNNGGVGGTGLLGGNIGFRGTSSAGACTFVNNSGTINGAPGGTVQFYENSTAGNGVFTNRGSGVSGAREGYMYFLDSSTAGNGTFTNEGAAISGGFAGYLDLEQTSTASNGTFINNGGTASGAAGGTTLFFNTSTAGNATLIANAGSNGGNGGTISFQHDSTGGTARVEVFGNGSLFIANNPAGVMIGSLEGSGNVLLAAPNLTVGSNNLNTTFSGLIQDGGANGSVTKVGAGILTFEGGASNDHIADTVTLSILSGSTVNLNFTGTPDTIRSLIVGGIGRVPGLYGSAASGAPNQLPEFAGTGQIRVLAAVGTSPVITSPLVATGTVGLPFTYQFTASGATSLAVSNLPAGLTFSTSLGAITGIPTTAGIFPAGLSATSSQGTTNATLTITVQPVPSGLVVVSSTCATGRTGRPFSFQLRTIGGSSATRFAVENVLPPGLNLDSSTGFISGTPTSDGSFGLAVSAIDGAATTNATLQLTFTSDPTVPIITSPATAILTPGQVFTYTITADANGTFGYIGSDGIVHQAPSPSCAGLPAGLCFDGNHTISGTFNPPFGSDRRSLTRPNQTGGIITNVQLFSANPPNGASIISLFPLREVTGAKNIATRLAVGTGENVLIGGFIIAESVARKRTQESGHPCDWTLLDPIRCPECAARFDAGTARWSRIAPGFK